MSCFANQVSGGIRCSKSCCLVLSARLNVVVPPWGISQLEYSPQLALVGPWAMLLVLGMCRKEEQKDSEARKGIAKVNIHWGSSGLKSTFVFPSSPSPQLLPNGRDVILCSCRVCSEFVLWGYNFWSLSFFPLCLSTLSPGFFSPPPADVKVDYKVIQLEKLPGNKTNNCFLHKNSKFWVGFLGLQSHPGDYVQLSPTAGYSSSLLVCFSDHQWVVAEDKFLSVWCYSWGFRGVPTQNFNCHKHLETCGTERNEPIWQTTLIAPK